MAFKLKTSKNTEEILSQAESRTNIPYATLVKIAIALSLRKGTLCDEDFLFNNLGRELNRQTITGDADALYKCLFEICADHHMTDEEFFPTTVKAHLDRGALLLQNELKYGSNDILLHLVELDKSI